MNVGSDNSPQVRSWRDIPQEVRTRAMSKTGKRRYAMSVAKVVGGTAFVACLGWGTFELISTIENNPREIATASQTVPLKDIVPQTDGVLGQEWVVRTLGIPKGASLLELDLNKLQTKLLASGQVKSAILGKSFPSTLTVRLYERSPVARVMVEGADGNRTQYLVARDGVVYPGDGYDDNVLKSIPWLSGVRLSKTSSGISPIEDMEIVADLIAKAKYEAEHLYPLFQIVDLSKLRTDGLIQVSSPTCEAVVFSVKEDFFQQLALFDSILDTVAASGTTGTLARIDLSYGREVPIAFRPLPAQLSTGPGAKKGATPSGNVAPSKPERRDLTPAFFNFQRNTTKREL